MDIFGGIFDEDDSNNNNKNKGSAAASSSNNAAPQRPPKPRPENNLVGLLNQGTTCYLNSLIQAMYMTPELRQGLYALNLKEDLGVASMDQLLPQEKKASGSAPSEIDLEQYAETMELLVGMGFEKDLAEYCIRKCDKRDNQQALMDWVFDESNLAPYHSGEYKKTTTTTTTNKGEGSKQKSRVKNIPLQLLRLFGWLEMGDNDAVSTQDLTTSFGWHGNDVTQQHDIQELNRVLFDALTRSLKKTSQETLVSDLYQGCVVNCLLCLKCGVPREREEIFEDLIVPVEGKMNLHHSLASTFGFQDMNGCDQLSCETCGCKTDHLMFKSMTKCPPVLTIALQRFGFDYAKGQRYKVAKALPFPLVLDMAAYDHSMKNRDKRKAALEQWLPYELEEMQKQSRKQQTNKDKQQQKSSNEKKNGVDVIPKEEVVIKEKYDPKLKEEQNKAYFLHSNDLRTDDPTLYDLFAVVIHRGGAYGGHYHAYIRDVANIATPSEEEVVGTEALGGQRWYDFNDSVVRMVAAEDILKQFGGSQKSESAYLLLYRNRNLTQKLLSEANVTFPDNLIKTDIDAFNAGIAQKREAFDLWQNKISVRLRFGKDLLVNSQGEIIHEESKKRADIRLEVQKASEVACVLNGENHPSSRLQTADADESMFGCLGEELGGGDDISSKPQTNAATFERDDAPEGVLEIDIDRRNTSIQLMEKACALTQMEISDIMRLDAVSIQDGVITMHQNVFNRETDEFTPTLAELSVFDSTQLLVWDGKTIGNQPYTPPVAKKKVPITLELTVRVFRKADEPSSVLTLKDLTDKSSFAELKEKLEEACGISKEGMLVCKYDDIGLRMIRDEEKTLGALLDGVWGISVEPLVVEGKRPVSIAIEEFDKERNKINVFVIDGTNGATLNSKVAVSGRKDWTIVELKKAALCALNLAVDSHRSFALCRTFVETSSESGPTVKASSQIANEENSLLTAPIADDEVLLIQNVDKMQSKIAVSFVYRKLNDKRAVAGQESKSLVNVPRHGTVHEAKKLMCESLQLDPRKHRIRTINCFGEPLDIITSENRSLAAFMNNSSNVDACELWLEEGRPPQDGGVTLRIWFFADFPSMVIAPPEVLEKAMHYTQVRNNIKSALTTDSDDVDIPLPELHTHFALYTPSLFSPKVVREYDEAEAKKKTAKPIDSTESNAKQEETTTTTTTPQQQEAVCPDLEFFSCIGQVDANKDDTCKQLKASIMGLLPNAHREDQIRLWVDGKLLRTEEGTLKKQGVTADKNIVVQLLPLHSPIPRPMQQNQVLLFGYRRRHDVGSFEFVSELLVGGSSGKGLFPADIKKALNAAAMVDVELEAWKYIPFCDDWIKIPLSNDDDQFTKEYDDIRSNKVGLRSKPWLLRDGDIIVFQEQSAPSFVDIFDATLPRRFRNKGDALDSDYGSSSAASAPKVKRKEVGIHIAVEEYDDDDDDDNSNNEEIDEENVNFFA